MQIGCGATTKQIRGRRYVYFWHYEERDGHRHQVFRYIGPLGRESTRARLAEAIGSYYDRAGEELRRRRGEALAKASPG